MPDSRGLLEELQSVFSGSNTLLDSLLPPILFLIINTLLGFQAAMSALLAIGAGITVLRLARGHKFWYALGGIGAALLAIGLALFNLPSIWLALVVVLIISYVVGSKRLRVLRGPSVEEFQKNSPPQRQGQHRGFYLLKNKRNQQCIIHPV